MKALIHSKQLALQLCIEAEKLVSQKQLLVAKDLCQQSLKLNPNCDRADKILGIIHQAQNQLSAAEYWYKKALEKQPDAVEVYVYLGNLYIHQSYWSDAIAVYQIAIKLQPNLIEVYQSLAKAFIELNQPLAAFNYLNQALTYQSNLSFEVDYITVGDIFCQQQKLDQAYNCYQQAIKLNPNFFKSYHKLASVLADLKQWQEAITAYQKAIQLNPNFCWSYQGLGQTLVKLGEWQESITAYQKAIQLNPNFCWSYYHLGKAYIDLEQWNDAAQAFEQAITINSEIPQFYQELGRVYMKLKAWEKATSLFKARLRIDSNSANPKIYINLAEALIQLGRWQDVISVYCQIKELNYQSHLNYFHFVQFAKAYREQKEYKQAIICYQHAINRQPRKPWLYTLLAETLQQDNQLEAAIDAYQQGIKLGLNSAWISINLGNLYTQIENFQAATTAYQQAGYQTILENYPHFIETDRYLKPCNCPNFLIIGASKCGTTSLYHNLIEHPQILPALKKEIKFWHDDLKQGLDWYLSHFLPSPDTTHYLNYLTGEASPNYLDLPETAQRVYQCFPQMKLIIILRNPIERAISHYYHWVRLGLEYRSLEEVVETELKTIDTVLQFPIQYQHWYQSINYIARGVYIGFIQQWMAVFPPEQLLILHSQDLADNPEATMQQVFSFLGLPNFPNCHYTQLNVGKYPPISPGIFQTLSQFYQPFNQQLEEYLGIQFGWDSTESTL
ncbi:MAG: tetratricopeptide repeat protein [Microcoleaceae cyanobacterium]